MSREGTRVLVIANETLASERARDVISRLSGPDAREVVVVVPAVYRSRMEHWLSSGTDKARAAAQERLAVSVGGLRDMGVPAVGELGDADPAQALDDAVRVHRPSLIILCTHTPERSLWIEKGLVPRARGRYDARVVHVVVDLAKDTAEVHDDPRPSAVGTGRVRLFARLAYQDAMRVREAGFTGPVRMRATPPEETGEGVTFSVEVPRDEVPAMAGGGEVEVPAGLLNRHGPPVLMDDWSE